MKHIPMVTYILMRVRKDVRDVFCHVIWMCKTLSKKFKRISLYSYIYFPGRGSLHTIGSNNFSSTPILTQPYSVSVSVSGDKNNITGFGTQPSSNHLPTPRDIFPYCNRIIKYPTFAANFKIGCLFEGLSRTSVTHRS